MMQSQRGPSLLCRELAAGMAFTSSNEARGPSLCIPSLTSHWKHVVLGRLHNLGGSSSFQPTTSPREGLSSVPSADDTPSWNKKCLGPEEGEPGHPLQSTPSFYLEIPTLMVKFTPPGSSFLRVLVGLFSWGSLPEEGY